MRWFGDPSLTEADLKTDDYFSRQDLDASFADETFAITITKKQRADLYIWGTGISTTTTPCIFYSRLQSAILIRLRPKAAKASS